MSQPTLIDQARAGDMDALSELFAEWRSALQSYVFRLTANRAESEDYVQDIFLEVHKSIHTFRAEGSFKSWLFTIATRYVRAQLARRQAWRYDTFERAKVKAHDGPESASIMQAVLRTHQTAPNASFDLQEHIDFCFTCTGKMLPLDQQVALLLKDIHGFKVKEVALIMELRYGVVRHLLHDARTTMMRLFDNRCALVNKNGVCHQCSALSGLFNADANIHQLKLAQEGATSRDQERLYQLRLDLIQAVTPPFTGSADLHDTMLKLLFRPVNQDPAQVEEAA
ncbi:MAG: hypothetical protein RhofKO_12710 [Rhodothermales bacterium]